MSCESEKGNINESTDHSELIVAMEALAAGDHSARVGGDDDLAVAFNDMACEIARRDSERMDLIAGVAHDLRSPMTSVIGFVDGILNGAVKPEDREKYLRVIRSECVRLSELVAQLLDVSRIQSGDRKFKCEPFDICEKARIILISFERRIEEKRLEVEFNCERDNMLALGDSDAVHQVLYNVCDNAVKYACDGGKYRIEIKTDEKNASFVRVSVYNEGIGVPQDGLAHVFERYYKVDTAHGSKIVSTGLGLYISKLIVDAQGGTIDASSEYGKWFCVSFTVKRSV